MGNYVILIINSPLYLDDMKHNLTPRSIRLSGAEVNECPKYLSCKPRIEDYSIYFLDDEDFENGYRIPLELHGAISYIPISVPTKRELMELARFNLTHDPLEWNPHTEVYGNQEQSMLNYQGELVEKIEIDCMILGLEHQLTDSSQSSCGLVFLFVHTFKNNHIRNGFNPVLSQFHTGYIVAI